MCRIAMLSVISPILLLSSVGYAATGESGVLALVEDAAKSAAVSATIETGRMADIFDAGANFDPKVLDLKISGRNERRARMMKVCRSVWEDGAGAWQIIDKAITSDPTLPTNQDLADICIAYQQGFDDGEISGIANSEGIQSNSKR